MARDNAREPMITHIGIYGMSSSYLIFINRTWFVFECHRKLEENSDIIVSRREISPKISYVDVPTTM